MRRRRLECDPRRAPRRGKDDLAKFLLIVVALAVGIYLVARFWVVIVVVVLLGLALFLGLKWLRWRRMR